MALIKICLLFLHILLVLVDEDHLHFLLVSTHLTSDYRLAEAYAFSGDLSSGSFSLIQTAILGFLKQEVGGDDVSETQTDRDHVLRVRRPF